jgi:hypothetical protein
MTAEEFIKDCTRHCANDIVGWDKNGLPLYHEWLTPEQALRAVEMAREEVREQMFAQTVEAEGDNGYGKGCEYTRERIKEALLSEVLPCFMHGGEADEVVAKLEEVLDYKTK